MFYITVSIVQYSKFSRRSKCCR